MYADPTLEEFTPFFKNLKRADFTTLFSLFLNVNEITKADNMIQNLKNIEFGVQQPLSSDSISSDSQATNEESQRSEKVEKIYIPKPKPRKVAQFKVLFQTYKTDN